MAHPDVRDFWKQLIKGKLEVIDIPGGHSEFMHQPHVDVLARKLKPILDRARHKTEPAALKTVSETEPAAASAAD
jgi:thioesterase domain-containing protein